MKRKPHSLKEVHVVNESRYMPMKLGAYWKWFGAGSIDEMACTCSQAWQLTPWHYWRLLLVGKDGLTSWNDARERLWTDLISDRSRWRQDSKWECMSETWNMLQIARLKRLRVPVLYFSWELEMFGWWPCDLWFRFKLCCDAVAMSVRQWTCDVHVAGSSPGWEAEGKLLTPVCLCHQAV